MAVTGRWRQAALGLMVLTVALALAPGAFAQGQEEPAGTGSRAALAGGLPCLVASGEDGKEAFPASFIKPLGITTFALLATTLTVGLRIRKKRRVLLPVHKTLAFITLASALCHGLLVLLSH
jgi:hypothetical protein